MINNLKLKGFLSALTTLTALTACDPSSNGPVGPGDGDGTVTSSVKIGCGTKSGISMSCISNSGENLGNFNLSMQISCSAAQTATQIRVSTNFTNERSGCAINNQTLKRENTLLNQLLAKTGPGGVFEGDSDLMSIDPAANFEWKCTEQYSPSTTVDLSHFYHLLVFQRDEGSNIVSGVLENRNIYVDSDALEYDGASRCTFQFNAN